MVRRSYSPRIAVIGGGISGLAAAHRLTQLLPSAEIRLFEASPRLGGPLFTLAHEGAVCEQGADSFLTKDALPLELCRELDLESEIIPTNTEHRRALVVAQGRLVPVPAGFVLMQPRQLLPLMHSPVLSPAGKLRAVAEPSVARCADVDASDYDESVASFATRRLGREAFERLVEPLIAGIFVADATKLSLAATYPEFIIAERDHGSLWRAWQNRRGQSPFAQSAEQKGTVPLLRRFPPSSGEDSGARYGAFVTLRGGLSTLISALAASLQPRALPGGSSNHGEHRSIALNSPVAAVQRLSNARWRVADAAGRIDRLNSDEFDGVIITLPARQASPLVHGVDQQLSDSLARIQAASSVVVTLLYPAEQIARPLDAFGLVVPRVENRQLVAASFPSVKFPGRTPAGFVPVRAFFGGALRPELVDYDDADLVAVARRELGELIGASGAPAETFVTRWRDAMPQYHLGHLPLVDKIDARVAGLPGLELAGNSYRGVGIPQTIRSGRAAAERLASTLP